MIPLNLFESIGKLFVKIGIKTGKTNSPTQKINQKNIKGGASAKNTLILKR